MDNVSLFSMFDYIKLNYAGSSEGALCPLIFYNANIYEIYITYMDDHYLSFYELSTVDDDFDLNSTVVKLSIDTALRIDIDEHMIDKQVFARLKRFIMRYSIVNRIDERAFYHTQNLNEIRLGLLNMRAFIQSSNNAWMSNLNRNIRVNYSDADSVAENFEKGRELLLTFETYDFGSEAVYTFPDEDLIYFENFPHEQFLFFYARTNYEFECTETLRWLFQNAEYYEHIMNTVTCFTNTDASSKQTTQSSTKFSNSTLIPFTAQPSTKPTNESTSSTTLPITQIGTEQTINLTSQYLNQSTPESTSRSTLSIQITTSKLGTNGFNNTETESKEVLLRVYLWTVIPIGVVCLIAIVSFVVFSTCICHNDLE